MTVKSLLNRVGALPASIRHPAAHEAFASAVLDQPAGAVCFSIGGGPKMVHPRLVNLNIRPFANVHVVGTAYQLPIPDNAVDSVYCEAVLEHLEDPRRAVAEMHRVLKAGGQVFAATPFLQPFHAYPDHFQNFTLNGHLRLFEAAGFKIVAAGPCNGPAFAMVDLISNFAREYFPTRPLSRAAFYALRIAGAPVVAFDRLLLRLPTAHVLASSTFVHGLKSSTTCLAA